MYEKYLHHDKEVTVRFDSKDKVLILCDDCEEYSESDKYFLSCQYCGNVNVWNFGSWEFE